MKSILIIFSSIILLAAVGKVISEKHFTKCELAQEMYRLGTPMKELSDWVCAARYESNYNTSAIGPPNRNGSRDYGIFQINDKLWCKNPGKPSRNGCNVTCAELLTDDITKSVKCAKIIKGIQGMNAWIAWKKKCRKVKPTIDECFNENNQ